MLAVAIVAVGEHHERLTPLFGREPVECGAAAVLIGAQESERVAAEEWARRLGTINYEITCGISARVPRGYHRDGVPEADEPRGAAS
jgi:alanine racemase